MGSRVSAHWVSNCGELTAVNRFRSSPTIFKCSWLLGLEERLILVPNDVRQVISIPIVVKALIGTIDTAVTSYLTAVTIVLKRLSLPNKITILSLFCLIVTVFRKLCNSAFNLALA